MTDVNDRRLDRLKNDLMDRGMNEREAYHRAKAFLKKVNREA